jgi:hypothetical protein
MRVGLVQIDGKWPNLALMKLSAHHKACGDHVEWFMPLREYDQVYASKVFTFSHEPSYLPIKGLTKAGTGYIGQQEGMVSLPDVVERKSPDYSLYPEWPHAMGFTTRGCPNRCAFCVVPRKEGRLGVVGDLYSFWAGQKSVILLDNNLTAAPMDHFKAIIDQLTYRKVRVDFSQGLDLRRLTEEHAQLLGRVRRLKRIHFAWDNVRDEAAIRRGLGRILRAINGHDIMVYVLIGFDSAPDEDLYRVEALRGLGVGPFVMPYDRTNLYQRRFARWVNHKAAFNTVSWAEYVGVARGQGRRGS